MMAASAMLLDLPVAVSTRRSIGNITGPSIGHNGEDNLRRIIIVAALAALAIGGAALAQTPNAPMKRTVFFKTAVPNSDYEVVTAEVEIAGGFKAGRHLHPGVVDARVTEGEFWLAIDGQKEKIYTAGQSLEIPERAIHSEGAATDKPVKLIATYVVKKGEPMVQPVK